MFEIIGVYKLIRVFGKTNKGYVESSNSTGILEIIRKYRFSIVLHPSKLGNT